MLFVQFESNKSITTHWLHLTKLAAEPHFPLPTVGTGSAHWEMPKLNIIFNVIVYSDWMLPFMDEKKLLRCLFVQIVFHNALLGTQITQISRRQSQNNNQNPCEVFGYRDLGIWDVWKHGPEVSSVLFLLFFLILFWKCCFLSKFCSAFVRADSFGTKNLLISHRVPKSDAVILAIIMEHRLSNLCCFYSIENWIQNKEICYKLHCAAIPFPHVVSKLCFVILLPLNVLLPKNVHTLTGFNFHVEDFNLLQDLCFNGS